MLEENLFSILEIEDHYTVSVICHWGLSILASYKVNCVKEVSILTGYKKKFRNFTYIVKNGGTYMRKKLAVLLAICLVAGTFNGMTGMPEVRAAEVQQEKESNRNFTCNVLGTDSVRITGYTGQETELAIPSEINGRTVTEIGSYAFSGCSGLTRIEIPSGVTRISDFAFKDCSGLTGIEIPSGVTLIGESTFSGCSGLTRIEIPSSVTKIGFLAFYGCSGLTIYCSKGSYAEQYAKSNNFIIRDISETTENNPAEGTGNGSTGSGNSGNGNSDNNSDYTYASLFGDDWYSVEITGYNGQETKLVIPSEINGKTVKCIGFSAFKNCSNIKSIKLPDTLKEIEAWAFSGCSSLTDIEIPDGVTKLGSSFDGCSNLKSVKLPNGITEIAGYMFKDCSSLTDIKLPNGIIKIDGGAFSGCSSLKSIELPDGITEIGDSFTFHGCSSLTDIKLPDGLVKIGNSAFYGCNSLTDIEIPNSVRNIGESAFSGCSSLTDVEIPDGVTEIRENTFFDCTNLQTAKLPGSVTSIASWAFFNCENLKLITIPDGVKNIDPIAFNYVNPELTIICSQGSYAEQYAKENNFAIKYVQGTPDQNPTEKPGSGDTEEPGKEPTEKPGTETPGTPGQNPTEKPGNGSADKPAVSLDGKTVQTITAEDIVKTMGDAPFYLDAETDGDGMLTYESKNPGIVKVDGTGKATIVSEGKAKISVTASATDNYSSAKKTVTVTVIPEGYTEIRDIDDLYAIRNNPGGNYILVNDIDMSETQKGGEYDFGGGWTPIEEFSGTLDGNGYRVIGMHIFGDFVSQAEIGLFGEFTGTVKNLGMIGCEIDITTTENAYVGTIAGRVDRYYGGDGGFENCYSIGNITVVSEERSYVGGLCGSLGRYKNCYNACEINCVQSGNESCIGGIGGSGYFFRNDDIQKCYNLGNIEGNEQSTVGALCGDISSNSSWYIYRWLNCYYLKDTAPQGMGIYVDNSNCVALTEAQMKNPKLFTGFDFANTWEIDPYCSYPYPQLKNNRMVRINSIQLKTAPAKLTYSQGESLRLNGAALELSYEDGINTTIPLEKDMLSGYNMNRIGRQTVTVSYGGEETSFDIEVKEVQVSGISIPKTLSLNRSKQKQLTASITPANASNKSITWESDNPGVASVNSSGLVKAKAKGRAVITATASNGLQAKCTVTVLVPAASIKLSHSSLSMAAGSQRSIKAQLLPLESTDSVNWKSSNKSVAEVYDGSVLAKKEGTAKITAYAKSGAKASCTVTIKKSGSGSSSEIKKITSKKAKIKSAKNVKKRRVTLKLSGSVNGGGYKIQYGTSRKFKGAKTVTVKGNTASIKKLKAKKTYYIRARIYKKISGKTYYGKWSNVKSVKIKK